MAKAARFYSIDFIPDPEEPQVARRVVDAKAALSPVHVLDDDTFTYLLEAILVHDPTSLRRLACTSMDHYQRVIGWLQATPTLPPAR